MATVGAGQTRQCYNPPTGLATRSPSREGVFFGYTNGRNVGVTRFSSSHSQRFHQSHPRGAARGQRSAEDAYEGSKQHAMQEDLRSDAKVEEHLAEVCEVGGPR